MHSSAAWSSSPVLLGGLSPSAARLLLGGGGGRRGRRAATSGEQPAGERASRCAWRPPQPEMMKERTKPKRARASVKAMPRNMVVRTMPAASGWRAMARDGVADDDADADAGADGGAAVDDAAADGGEAGDELAGVLLGEDVQHGVLLVFL